MPVVIAVWRPYRLMVLLTVLPGGLGVIPMIAGWQRGRPWDVVLGGILLGVCAAVGAALSWFAGRQRLEIDGSRVRVRIARWRGPVDLRDVVAVTSYAGKGGPILVLVQRSVGTPVGVYSAVVSGGAVRPGKYRGLDGRRWRYVVLMPWMVQREGVPERLRAHLDRPGVLMDLGARVLLGIRRAR